MVSLVKIRKKAKEKKERPQASAERPQASGLGPQDAAPETSAPSTQHSAPSTDKLAEFLASAGERRGERARESDEPAVKQVELLTFSIGDEMYAIDIEHVVEIVTPRTVTRVPNADSSVVGILSLRGTIVTLIDVRLRLNQPPAAQTPETRVVVIDRDGDNLGFVVDRVLHVVKIAAADIDPHPVAHSSEQDDSVRGVFRLGDALTILLDLDKLLASRFEVASAS